MINNFKDIEELTIYIVGKKEELSKVENSLEKLSLVWSLSEETSLEIKQELISTLSTMISKAKPEQGPNDIAIIFIKSDSILNISVVDETTTSIKAYIENRPSNENYKDSFVFEYSLT